MFDRKPNLVRHRRVHQAKVLNLVCSKCAKTFSNASNLKTHLNDVHFEKKMDKPKMALVSNKGDTFFKVFLLLFRILSNFEKYKGIAPVELVDASTQTESYDTNTQTESKCDCHVSNELPQLKGGKWKDNIYVRYAMEPPSKRRKID